MRRARATQRGRRACPASFPDLPARGGRNPPVPMTPTARSALKFITVLPGRIARFHPCKFGRIFSCRILQADGDGLAERARRPLRLRGASSGHRVDLVIAARPGTDGRAPSLVSGYGSGRLALSPSLVNPAPTLARAGSLSLRPRVREYRRITRPGGGPRIAVPRGAFSALRDGLFQFTIPAGYGPNTIVFLGPPLRQAATEARFGLRDAWSKSSTRIPCCKAEHFTPPVAMAVYRSAGVTTAGPRAALSMGEAYSRERADKGKSRSVFGSWPSMTGPINGCGSRSERRL